MSRLIYVILAGILLSSGAMTAQIPPKPHPNQHELLESENEQLEQNKKLVYNFWRKVVEARHLDLAKEYMKEDYIQHNPNAETGRQAFIDFFSRFGEPQPIQQEIQWPLINIVAEGDIVVLSFAREFPVPEDTSKTYTTTWFDMFRIEDGKIAEHWDSARMR